jgi:hypothetical protein
MKTPLLDLVDHNHVHRLCVLKHITLSLIRLDPIKRKGGIKARRLIDASSDRYRAELLGLKLTSCDWPHQNSAPTGDVKPD